MSTTVQSLTPFIHAILTEPGIDMATISAKRVRARLLENEELDLDEAWIRENKAEIDLHIAAVFKDVTSGLNVVSSHTNGSSVKRKREEDDGEDDGIPPSSQPIRSYTSPAKKIPPSTTPTPSKPKPKTPKATPSKNLDDESYARMLDSELNSRRGQLPRRAAAPTPKKKKAKSSASSAAGTMNGESSGKKKKAKKSREQVEDDDDRAGGSEEDGGAEEEAKPKKRKGGFAKEYLLSEPLSILLQENRLSRPQVVKKLWDYIKGNNLQNPMNKKEILCDQGMRSVFGSEKVGMFAMNKILGEHLYEQYE